MKVQEGVRGAPDLLARAGGRRRALSGASLVTLLCAASPVLAQSIAGPTPPTAADQPAEAQMIVVTAQRRTELSRDVPITITTVDQAQIRQANIVSLLSLPKLATGVRFDQQGAYTQPTIRGVGTTLVQTGAGSSVGIYVDGFYLPNSLALDFQFLNVESLQVLKGPQGTLFGRNTTGGAILVKTAEPSEKPSAVADVSYGRFNSQKYQAYATAGIAPNLAVSIEGLYSKGDGFQHNIYSGSLASGGGFAPGARANHPGAYENWAVRTALKATPTDKISLLLRYAHSDTEDPTGVVTGAWVQDGVIYSAGAAIPGTQFGLKRGEVANNARDAFRIRTDTVQLTNRFDLGVADLTSYTQYRSENTMNQLDNDFSSAAVLALDLPERDKTASQEFLLSSKPESRLQYSAGLFFFEQKTDAGVGLAFGGVNFFPFSATGAKTRTAAAFVDATYELLPNLFVTGGARYSHDEVRDPYYQTTPGVAGVFTLQPDYKANKLSPRAVIRYKPTEDSSVYASFTKGYKSAIPDYRATSGEFYLKPENIMAYEAGYKLANRKLSVEVAGFYYDYKNLQNGSYHIGETILSNAARSRIKGIDGSVKYWFGHGFEASAAATYLDAKYKSYPTAGLFTPIIVGGVFRGFDTSRTIDASGNQMQGAPKFTANLRGSYTTDLAGGRLVASANLYHTSTNYFDAANRFRQGSYELVGARLEWTDPTDRYTVGVFGENLTDSKYRTAAIIGTVAAGAVWGTPATYGASLRVKM